MTSSGKIPVSDISAIDHQTDTSNLNILVGVDEMYGESLSDSGECFVMVDDNKSVEVMTAGGSSVQQLLSDHETSSIGVDQHKLVQRMQIDSSKALEIMSSRHSEHIKLVQVSSDKTVEVLPMEDGKTVEIVQMDRNDKTIEVVDMDSMKHSEVIHIDGSSSIELLSVGDGTSLKRPTILKKPPQVIYPKRKSKGTQNPANALSCKKKCSSESSPSSLPLSLGSLASINSIEMKAPKMGSSSHHFSPMPSVTTLVTSRQSQVMENDLESITHVTPSIILSSDKRVVSSSVENLNDSIIISWSSVHSNHSSVETQTEPYVGSGPSFNMFFCTFHRDGSVETQCDMPVQKDISVSTVVVGYCGTKAKGNHPSSDGSLGHLTEGKGMNTDQADSTFLRSGQTLKLKDSLFKSSVKYDDRTDLNTNPDENTYEKGDIPLKKKRGRKKRKRNPLNDDFDYALNFESTSEGENVSKSNRSYTDIEIKDEPMDQDDEAATNILKTKGYGLRTKRRLKKMNDMHYMAEKVVKKKLEKIQSFPCQYCPEVFPNFTRLQRHAKEEHDSTCFSFPCEQCGVVFTRPHNLERHKDTKHGDGEKRFVCDQCGRRFGRQDVLAVHISMVHYKKSLQSKSSSSSVFGPNTFHCTACNQFFTKEQKLKAHKEGNLSCSKCDLTFECKVTLRTHQYKRHPTSCSECGKVCSSKHQMYLHRLSHDPKYVCNICQKGFLWKSQYAIHMSTHTGEKPELCDICGKSFAHKLAVNKHKWQEHDESKKKFKCEICGKRFVYKAKLQSHMRSHTGEKPFLCDLCSSTFSHRCNLSAHIKSVHGVYIQSFKDDGTTQTQLVKYKRVKKQPTLETQPTVNAVMTHSVESPVPEQPQIAIQEQVQMASESFETEAAVYQIVYAYQQ